MNLAIMSSEHVFSSLRNWRPPAGELGWFTLRPQCAGYGRFGVPLIEVERIHSGEWVLRYDQVSAMGFTLAEAFDLIDRRKDINDYQRFLLKQARAAIPEDLR